MANISDFKAQMLGGGARPNQFRAELTFPAFVPLGVIAGTRAQFLCKAAQMPASTIENISVLYRGRPVNFAGERNFAPWTVTIYNDVSFNIRNAFEQWQNGIQNYASTGGITNPRDYQVDLNIRQLDRAGNVIKTYTFHDAFPINIGPIALDFDQQNQIEQFDVEFQYNYFVSDVASGNSGFGLNASVSTPIGTFPIPV